MTVPGDPSNRKGSAAHQPVDGRRCSVGNLDGLVGVSRGVNDHHVAGFDQRHRLAWGVARSEGHCRQASEGISQRTLGGL